MARLSDYPSLCHICWRGTDAAVRVPSSLSTTDEIGYFERDTWLSDNARSEFGVGAGGTPVGGKEWVPGSHYVCLSATGFTPPVADGCE